jgi:hypothetical protein
LRSELAMTFTARLPRSVGRPMLGPNVGPHHTDLAGMRQRFHRR